MRDAFAVRTVLLYGEPEFNPPSDEKYWERAVSDPEVGRTIAAGILRVSGLGFAGTIASFRPRARTRAAGAVTVARFWAAVAGGIGDIYLPPALSAGRPSPHEDSPRKPPPGLAEPGRPATVPTPGSPPHVSKGQSRKPRLHVTNHDLLRAREGGHLVRLQHVTTSGARKDKGPVLLLGGSSVSPSIFRPVGVRETMVDRLLAEGYDVWLENWRGSLGRSPREYSLDEAAAIDHPAAVEAVARETGSREVKAVVHCLGSSGFMLALASGRLHTEDFEVTHVVSNAVSLHPMVPPASELKIRAFVPLFNRVVPYLDPQWARDVPLTDEPPPTAEGHQDAFPKMTPRGAVARALVTWSRLTHYEAENGVCNFAQFMYGAGPSTLYDESKLTEVTARWMEGQFAWAPARLYRQLARSLLAGHLVPMREWPADALAPDLFENGPAPMDTRITFITGTRNRCFSPTSQRKTYEWFSAYHAKDQHQFRPLEGFGHLDVWLAADQSAVHKVVLEGLRR
jgi:pimeloyl-ACP methyl ester carboxylesterase